MKISNINVNAYATQYSIDWSDKKGNRYHVWLDRTTRRRRDDTLYKNPPTGTKHKGEGYFPTRRLDVTNKANLTTFEYAMQEATRLGLFEKEEQHIADKVAAEKAANYIKYVEHCKKEAGPELYAALRNLLEDGSFNLHMDRTRELIAKASVALALAEKK